jgi:hypothetical protein
LNYMYTTYKIQKKLRNIFKLLLLSVRDSATEFLKNK